MSLNLSPINKRFNLQKTYEEAATNDKDFYQNKTKNEQEKKKFNFKSPILKR